jgi:hypothetical protein
MTLRKPPERPADPDARLVGKCRTCGTKVEVAAWEAFKAAPGKSSDPLADVFSAECPAWLSLWRRCGTRVYLMPK